ncbi:hypothetical protein OHO28_08945 [Streptomyces europaeiscabiei]
MIRDANRLVEVGTARDGYQKCVWCWGGISRETVYSYLRAAPATD